MTHSSEQFARLINGIERAAHALEALARSANGNFVALPSASESSSAYDAVSANEQEDSEGRIPACGYSNPNIAMGNACTLDVGHVGLHLSFYQQRPYEYES